MGSIPQEIERKHHNRKLSRSNSDADILGGEEECLNETEEDRRKRDSLRRRSHSIDDMILSGGEGEMMDSLETASSKIEMILGNDRKNSKSGSRHRFKGLTNLRRKEGRGRKMQRTTSQCEEESHSGCTTPIETLSSESSPSVSRKKAMIKKVRKSLLLNFNNQGEQGEEAEEGVGPNDGHLSAGSSRSDSSGERRSTSPTDTVQLQGGAVSRKRDRYVCLPVHKEVTPGL